MKTCCVTGHRPKGLPFDYGDKESKEYREYIEAIGRAVRVLIKEGFDTFITGMAQGVDMDFAEAVIEEKKRSGVRIEAALPHPGQDKFWDREIAERYRKILSECDKITVVSPGYYSGCMQKRNRYMVDRSYAVVAFWNGITRGGTYNTLQYAEKCGKKICIYRLPDRFVDKNGQ